MFLLLLLNYVFLCLLLLMCCVLIVWCAWLCVMLFWIFFMTSMFCLCWLYAVYFYMIHVLWSLIVLCGCMLLALNCGYIFVWFPLLIVVFYIVCFQLHFVFGAYVLHPCEYVGVSCWNRRQACCCIIWVWVLDGKKLGNPQLKLNYKNEFNQLRYITNAGHS